MNRRDLVIGVVLCLGGLALGRWSWGWFGKQFDEE